MTASIAQATIDVVATAQVHGGTRVITLSVKQNDLGAHVATLRAYDSNHPGDEQWVGTHVDTDARVAGEARAYAVEYMRPSEDNEACNCWAWWDSDCGRLGCWGNYRLPLASTMATANS